MDAIIILELSKTYVGGATALDGVYLSIREGEIFALLGPNGAGKSTTVRILITLSAPDAGQAFVSGYDVLRQPDRVRGAIGYVAQKSAVDREATARENLRLQGRLYGLSGSGLIRGMLGGNGGWILVQPDATSRGRAMVLVGSVLQQNRPSARLPSSSVAVYRRRRGASAIFSSCTHRRRFHGCKRRRFTAAQIHS